MRAVAGVEYAHLGISKEDANCANSISTGLDPAGFRP